MPAKKSLVAATTHGNSVDRAGAPHFSGKRRAERLATDRAVELHGGGVVLPGKAVDVSPQGVRIRMTETVLRSVSASTDPIGFLHAMEAHFADGLDVCFPGHGLRAFAEVVRLITRPKGGGDAFIGCRFGKPLSDAEWAKVRPQED